MSAVRAGTYNPRYRVNAGIDGKAKAESFDGGPATGSFTVRIDRAAEVARRAELTSRSRLTWLGHSTVLIELDGRRAVDGPGARAARRCTCGGTLRPVADVGAGRRRADLARAPRSPRRPVPARGWGAATRVDHPAPASARAAPARGSATSRSSTSASTRHVGELQVLAPAGGPPHEADCRSGASPRRWASSIEGRPSAAFLGDTDLFDAMAQRGPGWTSPLLPVWGWGPTHRRRATSTPSARRSAVVLLRPRVAIPIHWGTFTPATGPGAGKLLESPGPDFARHVARLAPTVDVRVLRARRVDRGGAEPQWAAGRPELQRRSREGRRPRRPSRRGPRTRAHEAAARSARPGHHPAPAATSHRDCSQRRAPSHDLRQQGRCRPPRRRARAVARRPGRRAGAGAASRSARTARQPSARRRGARARAAADRPASPRAPRRRCAGHIAPRSCRARSQAPAPSARPRPAPPRSRPTPVQRSAATPAGGRSVAARRANGSVCRRGT